MPAQWLYETAARWDAELAAVQAVVEDRGDDRTAGRRARPGRRRRPAHRPHRPRPARTARRRPRRQPRPARGVRRPLARRPRRPAAQGLGRVARSRGTEASREGSPTSAATRAAPTTSPRSPCPAPGDGPAAASSGPSTDRARRRRRARLAHPAARRDKGRPRPRPARRRTPPHRRARSAGSSRCPSALRRCTVAGAALRDGVLRVRFAPDPELWPADTVNGVPPFG